MTADELAVHVAEAVVCQAWSQELTRRHDHAAFTVRVAEETCETARRRLDAAYDDSDPRRISLAHAHLERALNILRESEAACEQIRAAVLAELRLLARTTGQRVLAELVDQWEAETPAPPLQCPDPPDAPVEQTPDKAPRSRPRWWWWRRVLPAAWRAACPPSRRTTRSARSSSGRPPMSSESTM
jgi:hypothetical protein